MMPNVEKLQVSVPRFWKLFKAAFTTWAANWWKYSLFVLIMVAAIDVVVYLFVYKLLLSSLVTGSVFVVLFSLVFIAVMLVLAGYFAAGFINLMVQAKKSDSISLLEAFKAGFRQLWNFSVMIVRLFFYVFGWVILAGIVLWALYFFLFKSVFANAAVPEGALIAQEESGAFQDCVKYFSKEQCENMDLSTIVDDSGAAYNDVYFDEESSPNVTKNLVEKDSLRIAIGRVLAGIFSFVLVIPLFLFLIYRAVRAMFAVYALGLSEASGKEARTAAFKESFQAVQGQWWNVTGYIFSFDFLLYIPIYIVIFVILITFGYNDFVNSIVQAIFLAVFIPVDSWFKMHYFLVAKK